MRIFRRKPDKAPSEISVARAVEEDLSDVPSQEEVDEKFLKLLVRRARCD